MEKTKKTKGPIWIKRVKPIKRNSKGARGFNIPKHNLDDKDILDDHLYSYVVYDLGKIGDPETDITKTKLEELEAELDDDIEHI